jgi:hypothetical protein
MVMVQECLRTVASGQKNVHSKFSNDELEVGGSSNTLHPQVIQYSCGSAVL